MFLRQQNRSTMDVMNCSKIGCDEILCETYIPDLGYICYGCMKDFKQSVSHIHIKSKEEMLPRFSLFMDLHKRRDREDDVLPMMSVYEFFEEYIM